MNTVFCDFKNIRDIHELNDELAEAVTRVKYYKEAIDQKDFIQLAETVDGLKYTFTSLSEAEKMESESYDHGQKEAYSEIQKKLEKIADMSGPKKDLVTALNNLLGEIESLT